MTPETPLYDLAVLGGGPGGYAAALRSAARGRRVCLVEADKIGGTCLNVGCIPTKALLHASAMLHQARSAAEWGIAATASLDGPRLMAAAAGKVARLSKGVASLLKARGVTVLRGRGRLAGPGELLVEAPDGGTQTVRARAVIVATGSRPSRPGFLPWDSGRVLTTDQATTAAALPPEVLIVGGGVIGCEFATFYAECGIPTTLVEMADRLAGTLDADASAAILRSLRKRNVAVHTGAAVAAATADDDAVTVALADGKRLTSAYVLCATGRLPNTRDIGLEALGVALDDAPDGGAPAQAVIAVDDRCRTNVPGVYAIGDVAERRQYAHLATRMGLVAADHAAGLDAADDRTVVPAGVYTHPEVACVGLSEAQARQADPAARAASFPLAAIGLAVACGHADGFVKLIAGGDGRLRGAVVVCPHATDVVAELALAMRRGLGVADLAGLIHAHPTFAEAVGEAADLFLGLPLHVARTPRP